MLTGSDTFILEAMLMGCDGALIGFAGTATAELVRMQALADAGEDHRGLRDLEPLGPLARICWRQPLRDYRVRTKYVADEAGRAAQFQGPRPVPEPRRTRTARNRPGIRGDTICATRGSCPRRQARVSGAAAVECRSVNDDRAEEGGADCIRPSGPATHVLLIRFDRSRSATRLPTRW